MNGYQAAFLVSLFLPFAFLLFLSNFINNRLLAAGFNFSNLILVGTPEYPMSDFIASAAKAFRLDSGFAEIASSPAVLITAAIIVATAFYSKVLHTGQLFSLCHTHPPIAHSSSQVVPSLCAPISGRNSPLRKRSRCHPTLPCMLTVFSLDGRVLTRL